MPSDPVEFHYSNLNFEAARAAGAFFKNNRSSEGTHLRWAASKFKFDNNNPGSPQDRPGLLQIWFFSIFWHY